MILWDNVQFHTKEVVRKGTNSNPTLSPKYWYEFESHVAK